MTAKQYIFNRLEGFSERFVKVRFSYEFRTGSSIHVIEVLPLDFFQHDQEYLDAEYIFEKEFQDAFPNEEILFISSESLIQIESPERTFGLLLYSFESENYSEIEAITPIQDFFSSESPSFATAA